VNTWKEFDMAVRKNYKELYEKSQKAVETLEHILEKRENKIEELERIIRDYQRSQERSEEYANMKRIERLENDLSHYKFLHNAKSDEVKALENAQNAYIELLSEITGESKLESIEDVKMLIINSRKRNAGRKASYDLEKCSQLIMNNKEKSLRAIQEILKENGEKMSLSKISEIKKTY
jgi:TolA-binding protein